MVRVHINTRRRYRWVVDAIVAALSNLDASKQIGRNGQTVALKNFSPIIQGKRISNFYHTL